MNPATLPRAPLVEGGHTYATLSAKVSAVTERPMPFWWWVAFLFSGTMLAGGFGAATYLISTGVGVWGENNAANWAFDITNFVFWIGIGHAGTLISAILFLFRQKWRTSINRFAEAMTLFAVTCAAVYPGIHVGRFWYAWFMAPVPNANLIWQNFRSPLLWDAFAVGTYFTVSLLFWYTGLVPDLAVMRDRAQRPFRKTVLGLMALGWRGSAKHWRHYEAAYLILAGISTPLVLSVHSIVSFDFAVSVVPGWHTTIFPPYFVAGAIFGGFAMVLFCVIPVRELFNMKEIVTTKHLDLMAKFILATGTLVGYAYAMEFFIAFYSGVPDERKIFLDRAFGSYWWAYWIMVTCNLFVPQLLWMKAWRQTPWRLFLVATLVNVGMWFERFVIIVQSLTRKYLPTNFELFYPTWVDWLQMIGDFGLFFTLTLLFIRFLPMFAIAELKHVMPGSQDANFPPGPESVGQVSNLSGSVPSEPHGQVGNLSYLRPPEGARPWGVLAAFANPDELMRAAGEVRAAGYAKVDAATPFQVHGLNAILGVKRSRLPFIALAGGLTGLAAAIFLTMYLSAIDYPILVGGKEYNSWQAFVPIMFEMGVLFTAFASVIGMLALCGLPTYYHPLFRSDAFARASIDRFVLTVQATDPRFDPVATPELLARLGGTDIEIVEA